MKRGRALPGLVALGTLLALPAAPALAVPVAVPMQLDLRLLRDTLLRQVYTAPGPEAPLLDDGRDCQRLSLSEPRLDAAEGRLRLRSAAHARFGTFLLGRCNLPVAWSGEIEVLLAPTLEAHATAVRFHVVDSRVLRSDGSRSPVSGTLWDWMKASVHPRLGSFHVDLARPLDDLRALLPLVLPAEDVTRSHRLVDSVHLEDARIEEGGLGVRLVFEAPEPFPPPSPTEPSPSPEALAALEERLERFDAFLTFVLVSAGGDTQERQTRIDLLAVLLDARQELVTVLAEPPEEGPDPVRTVFVSTWRQLAPLLRRQGGTLSGDDSLRYLSFVTASDALAALDRLGPSVGLEISAAGLRRLARSLVPSGGGDPLAIEPGVDPGLREVFGFGEPLEPPPVEDDGAAMLRIQYAPVQRAVSDAERGRLRHWVPDLADLDEYLPLVQAVLQEAAARALAKKPMDPRFETVYGWLVPAAAWKESCWRQLVLRDGQPVALRSSAGAVGILQVNVRVWRGFYDAKALARDLPYNARAGAEILAHYLVDFAIPADEHGIGGSLDAAARATYAAYNGGPRALRRWRMDTAPASLRRIDQAFWRDYQAVKRDGMPDRATCWGG